jgi:hypothetical protein
MQLDAWLAKLVREANAGVATGSSGRRTALPNTESAGGSARPPQAVVIDLERIPSAGRDVALWLRYQRGTRSVPIVFVDGEPEKLARSQADLHRRFAGAARSLVEGGALWIPWRKQASGAGADLTQAAVRAFGLAAGRD